MSTQYEIQVDLPPSQNVMSLLRNRETLLGLGMIGVVLVMMIPLPAFMMDLLLVISLSSSLVIFLIALYSNRATEFTIFPTVLLMVTVFRLALNVASTRLILTEGGGGEGSAGQIIATFGNFVIGGNYIVGLIVFIILVVINFIVITKGAGRIAEVAARFTLDAMPGKQMAIDADLNAGLINEDQARKRRREVEIEADFYGSMDGASKFVRGDAIAGIIITIVNIVAGLVIGIVQHNLSFMDSAANYTLLTVGDGLVTQIPALIVSTAAGLVVTKVDSDQNISTEVGKQLFMQPQAFIVAAAILGIGGLHPSMPTIPFLLGAAVLVALATKGKKNLEIETAKRLQEEAANQIISTENKKVKPVIKEANEWIKPMDLLELEVGYGLVPLVDERQKGDLLKRMTHLRRRFAQEMGFVVPAIHVRDNLQLKQGEYSIIIKGVKVAGGDLFVEQLLAIDPGETREKIAGVDTIEPAYGLPAVWITQDKKEKAQLLGYTVVDNSTTLATHLGEVIRQHADDLLGRQEFESLMDQLKDTHAKLLDELMPNVLTPGQVLKILKNILHEGVPIKDLPTILETLAEAALHHKDTDFLTEKVRESLASTITSTFSQDGMLKVLVLDPEVDEAIARSLVKTDDGIQISIEPKRALEMINSLQERSKGLARQGLQPVVLTSPKVRLYFRKLIERQVQNCAVISHAEVTSLSKLESLGVIGMNS